jgi:hypothetical protein
MLIDERTSRAAESAVSARKALLARQWGAMQSQLGDKMVEPSTLLTVAAVGGILGWRGGAPKAAAAETKTCECAPAHKPSLLVGAFKSLAIAGLQVVASIASEEFVRTTMARGGEASGSATAEAVDASR